MQKLIAKLPNICLKNYAVIIPTNYATQVGNDEYCHMLESNNIFHRDTSAIPLYNIHKDTFDKTFNHPTDPSFQGNLSDYLTSLNIHSVQNTTEKFPGKYLCVVFNTNRDRIQQAG